MNSSFELSKWYADCVTGAGGAVIVYHAQLHWRIPTIHYANLLIHEPGGPVRGRYSLRRQPAPVHAGNIEWNSPVWRAVGVWSETGAAVREVLFESEAGCLEWNCVAPRSLAEVRIGDGKPFRGFGYAERLRLTIPPWRLPIRLLRWGRFVNERDALVWIDWRGPHNKQVVYDNGLPVSASSISDREVVLEQGRGVVSLDRGVILREGKLGDTALSVLAHVDRLLPARTFGMRECKWLSRAVLRRPGQVDSVGMAIHEVVEWP
ncbi:MAG: hypothetical protein HY858_08065 [Candidatus Solibacter usitatus]|nr:hypothetical protein [Candidatus Solibacter usitatus]